MSVSASGQAAGVLVTMGEDARAEVRAYWEHELSKAQKRRKHHLDQVVEEDVRIMDCADQIRRCS